MYSKGLGAVRDLVSGEQHPDDMSTTQKHAMHRVLGGVATMALLGAGVLAAGMAAAPLGVLLGATLFNVWAGSKHGKNLRDDIDELRAAREKKRREERKANGADADDAAPAKRKAVRKTTWIRSPRKRKKRTNVRKRTTISKQQPVLFSCLTNPLK